MTPDAPLDPLHLLAPAPRRRIRWLVVALGAAILIVLAGGGAALAFSLRSGHPTVVAAPSSSPSTLAPPSVVPVTTAAAPVDGAGQNACLAAKKWHDSGMADITETVVKQIHDQSIGSTNPDIVYRGNALYDAFNKAEIQRQLGELSGPEVQLRVLGPMIQFQTACVQARYPN